jgi:hypothetical protein
VFLNQLRDLDVVEVSTATAPRSNLHHAADHPRDAETRRDGLNSADRSGSAAMSGSAGANPARRHHR